MTSKECKLLTLAMLSMAVSLTALYAIARLALYE